VEGEELAGARALQGAGEVQKLIAGWRVADRGVAALIASWPGQH
jgi:hypothetical protein